MVKTRNQRLRLVLSRRSELSLVDAGLPAHVRDERRRHAQRHRSRRGLSAANALSIRAPSAASACRKWSMGSTAPTDEFATVPEAQLTNHYKRSKWQGEEVAVGFARKGLPVVIVNPSAPIGPYDVKPTPTGRIIVDFLNRRTAGVSGHGFELGACSRRGGRPHSRGGKRPVRRALHPRQRAGQLDDAARRWPRWKKSPVSRRRKPESPIGPRWRWRT